LFVSQDDGALELSKQIWGGVPRIGEVNPADEPYRTELERDRIAVYDLTQLKGSGGTAHSRAFDDINQVMAMVRERNALTQASSSAQARAPRPEAVALRAQ
jgi:esterase/lipase superfamily enzyme